MKRIFAIFLVISVCLSFTSCKSIFYSVDSLMRPPRLSGEDSILQTAFESSVLEYENVVMKTPFSGKYRSSYIFFDIDNDGHEEAIVLYSVPAEGNDVIAEVFKYSNDEWSMVSKIQGNSYEIYDVNFADINGDGCCEIFLSWIVKQEIDDGIDINFNLNPTRTLMIYSYDGVNVELIKTEPYTELFIKDLNNNNADEILIFKNVFYNFQNLTTMRLISFKDDYSISYDKETNITSMFEINNIVSDRIVSAGKSISRVFVDGAISDIDIVTEIIEIDEKNFDATLPLYNDNSTTHPRTLRSSQIYCMDVDNNGIIEIPTIDVFPYSQKISEDKNEPINLIVWLEYGKNGFDVKYKTLLNSKVGHIVFIPEDYIGNVSAIYDEENMNLTFYSIDSDGSFENVLFSFRIFTIPAWEDNNYNYELLYQTDTYVFGYLIFKADNYELYKKFISENFFAL